MRLDRAFMETEESQEEAEAPLDELEATGEPDGEEELGDGSKGNYSANYS